MSRIMIRLLYISQAAPSISDLDLRDILQSSQTSNAALDITGVLVFGGGTFVQVLEGPEQKVLRLYVKIMDDKRHDNCRIVYITPTRNRLFGEWSMGVIESDPLEFQHIAEFTALREETVEATSFKNIIQKFLIRLKAQ